MSMKGCKEDIAVVHFKLEGHLPITRVIPSDDCIATYLTRPRHLVIDTYGVICMTQLSSREFNTLTLTTKW